MASGRAGTDCHPSPHSSSGSDQDAAPSVHPAGQLVQLCCAAGRYSDQYRPAHKNNGRHPEAVQLPYGRHNLCRLHSVGAAADLSSHERTHAHQDAEAKRDAVADVNGRASDGASDSASDGASDSASDGASDGASDSASDSASDGASDGASDRTTNRPPDRTSNHTSDGTRDAYTLVAVGCRGVVVYSLLESGSGRLRIRRRGPGAWNGR